MQQAIFVFTRFEKGIKYLNFFPLTFKKFKNWVFTNKANQCCSIFCCISASETKQLFLPMFNLQVRIKLLLKLTINWELPVTVYYFLIEKLLKTFWCHSPASQSVQTTQCRCWPRMKMMFILDPMLISVSTKKCWKYVPT